MLKRLDIMTADLRRRCSLANAMKVVDDILPRTYSVTKEMEDTIISCLVGIKALELMIRRFAWVQAHRSRYSSSQNQSGVRVNE